MSLEVNTDRNNNRDATWLQNDNSIEMPLSPSTSESNATSYESTFLKKHQLKILM